jgi:uncharacterized protein (DUF486 family)
VAPKIQASTTLGARKGGVSPSGEAGWSSLSRSEYNQRLSHRDLEFPPPMPSFWFKIAPWGLLIASNVFMTFAWYGHLKNRSTTMLVAIFTSWLIALPEYLLAVPANRLGHNVYSTAQLKTGQEAITLIVFTLFSVFYLGEAISWKTLVGFGFIFVGVAIVMFFK